MSEVVITADKKKAIKSFVDEMSASMTRRTAEGEFQREAVKAIAEQYELDKGLLRKIARIYHDSKFSTVKADNQALEDMYVDVFGDKAV